VEFSQQANVQQREYGNERPDFSQVKFLLVATVNMLMTINTYIYYCIIIIIIIIPLAIFEVGLLHLNLLKLSGFFTYHQV